MNFYNHNDKVNHEFNPIFRALETPLKELNISLVKVNGTAYPDTLNEYSVTHTPFITLFINETGYIYNKQDNESRTIDKLNNWVKETLRPSY